MLNGLFTALITPFRHNLALDIPGLRVLIQRQLEVKVDGLVLLGTTGENPTLSEEEKTCILQVAVEEAKGKTALFAGTGANSTEKTIQNTLWAKRLGMEGALVVTPYYNRPTQEGIFRHFQAVAETCDFPLIIYNIPGRSGTNIETPTLQRISKLPNVLGVKETSGSLLQMMDVLSQIGQEQSDFSVLSGDDIMTFPLMGLGGHGVISVTSNLFPEMMKAMVDLSLVGDFKKAQSLHFKLLPLFKHLSLETNPIPIKAAMQFLGLPAGECRLPLCSLSNENAEKLDRFLKRWSSIEQEYLLSARE